jgi:hypothetical protein
LRLAAFIQHDEIEALRAGKAERPLFAGAIHEVHDYVNGVARGVFGALDAKLELESFPGGLPREKGIHLREVSRARDLDLFQGDEGKKIERSLFEVPCKVGDIVHSACGGIVLEVLNENSADLAPVHGAPETDPSPVP